MKFDTECACISLDDELVDRDSEALLDPALGYIGELCNVDHAGTPCVKAR